MRRAGKIGCEPDQHADAGGAEAVVPADPLAKRAADERRQKCPDIDAHIEDRIGAVAPRIARRVEFADLARHVGLEGAIADNEDEEREQQQRLERHHEMAERHQQGADDHRAAMSEHAVGDDPAEHRRQIDETGVEAIDVGGERLNVERTEQGFKGAFERRKPNHLAGVRRKHVLDHVEHEQRPHAVVGEALPHLGREQEAQALRMAEKFRLHG